jgi:hypothetical protein
MPVLFIILPFYSSFQLVFQKKLLFCIFFEWNYSAKCMNTVKLQTVSQVVAASVQMLAYFLTLKKFI